MNHMLITALTSSFVRFKADYKYLYLYLIESQQTNICHDVTKQATRRLVMTGNDDCRLSIIHY